jgi:hypothetical protein
MDRSFLSQPVVVAASRRFVCARLATYEDEAEGKFLKSLVRTRSGELENSVFAILGPDAKEQLVRPGRSMRSAYADAQAMADGMDRLADKYQPKAEVSALPLVSDVRLALDVASADGQPLVVVVAKDAGKRKELEETVAKLAWSKGFVGRFVYAACGGGDDLAGVKGADAGAVLLVVQPDKFGLTGAVIAQTADAAKLAATLAAGAKGFVREEKAFRTHVRDGQRDGVFWETKTPVSDPQEAAARERGRKK